MHNALPRAARGHFLFVLSVILGFALVFSIASVVFATVDSNVAASLTTQNQTIKASSSPVAIIGLNLAGDQTLASTTIGFIFSASGTTTDLAALGAATSSGIALYRDDPDAGTSGSFDAADDVVPLASAPAWVSDAGGTHATTTLTFAEAEAVPANDTGDNSGNDYFVVIQTDDTAVNGHAFLAQMIPTNIGWTGAQPAGPTAVQTNAVTIDTVAPTVNANMTGPANGSTGVPVSTFIHMGFSENLDQTTLNSTNITFTQNGTAVGAAIRPFPDGFDVISSSPPAYAPGSRFAKPTTVSTGFFQISGTNTIFPQGAYTAPARGDIVFTQTDTFPPEVGVVTNATLTSGTFAINGNALFRSSQVTKFASPTASGYTGDGASVGVGDLLVVNTSAKPADVRYNWHIVTTAQALNNAGLRLDNQDAAPTYATTTFARLMPSATSTTDSSGQLNATSTFAAGDLVFAKLSAGGDNLGAYAWHLVTTAETVNGLLGSGATPGTTTVLRLDSAAATTTFTAGSVIARLSTSAQGAVDAGAQNATVFSFGDLLFAKVTANASNLNAYNFHLVTGGATGATSTSLRLDNASANLNTSTAYVVTAAPGIKDAAGNSLAATSTLAFTTGSTGGTNITPPGVQSSQPQGGSQNHPINAPIKLTFSVAMNNDASPGANSVLTTTVVKLSTDTNGQPGTAITATNSYDSTTNTVTITPAANLTASTNYVVQVTTAAKSSTGASMPNEYRLYFRTSSGSDSTAPTVLGVNPTTGTLNVSRSQVFTAGFSEDMDPSTITSSTLTLKESTAGTAVAGNITYAPQSRSASFVPSTALGAETGYTFTVGAGLTGPADLSGNRLTASSTSLATTTATADTSAPSVSFASADNFGIAITFTETMKVSGGPNAADNIANYTLESPAGTSISLGGKTVTYDGQTKTARITGLSLSNGTQFKVTIATPVQDLAGNGISTSGDPAGNLAFGTVQNSSTTGGQLGPGTGTIDQSMQGMNPTQASPMTRIAGAVSDYRINFLAATSIPLGGQIVVTFPSGFDVSRASTTPAATPLCQPAIHGQHVAGGPTRATAAANADAGTVTITTAGAESSANAFICIELTGVVNSSVPSSSGYTVDIKTRDTAANNRTVLETKTTSPFFLGQAGSLTLTVNVFNDGNANSTINANEGISGARVFLFSPAIGGNSTTTNASGVASFTQLAAGDYMVGIDPGSLQTASSTVTYNSVPQPFTVSSANLVKNIIVTGGGDTVSISGTITGPSGTSVDVFAMSPNGFAKTTVALTGGADAYTLRVSPNTTYNVGVGPAMPEAHFTPGAPPPPPPTFTFMPPPNLSVVVGASSVTGKDFTLTAASKTIAGSVLDSAGSAVSNAGVFARPISNTSGGASSDLGFGSGGQTNTSGAFSINVIPGTYLVGVFKPGMPSVPDQQITVPSSGGNTPSSLTFKLGTASTLTISGTVKDNNGNAIPYAGVGGRKVVSTSDTTPIGGGQGNFVGGPTDANGAYTLYVTNGVWQIESFAPGFGKLGSKTVTVSGSSLSGQDFSAQTLTLGTLQGSTTQASVGVQGVMVRAEGENGANMAVSDSSGTYTMKLPVGTYSVSCFFPGVGDSAPNTGVAITDGGTTNSHCAQGASITVTVNLTDGTNPITGAYVDARTATGRGNGTSQSVSSGANATYTLTLPPGTYTIRAGHPSFGPIGSTASVSATQSITYTAPALFNVTGSVIASGVGANNAFVSLTGTPTGQSNVITTGAQTDSGGAFTIRAPAGSYQIRADKPGFISSPPATVAVSGNTAAGSVELTTAARTITGTVTLSGAGVSGAFVDATNGNGGFAVAQTDSAGAYSLGVSPDSWNLTAHSIGYEGSLSSVAAGATGQTIALSAISGFTVTAEKQETITPTQGGFVTNSDIGANFRMTIPANALGTGSNAGTVKTQANTAVPNSANGTVLSKSAVSISSVDSSGQPVKNLNDEVTIVVPYSEADIPSGRSESDIQLGVWNDATQTYDILSTTVDATNNTLTANISHFSDFAPIVPAQSSSSSSDSGGGGGGGGSVGGGGSSINSGITTTATTTAKAQITYPDGRVVYVDQNLGIAAAASGSASVASSAKAARFAVLLKQGSKHADVSRLQRLLGVEPTGYFGALTRAAVEAFQLKHSIAKRGDAGFGLVGPMTRAKLNELGSDSLAASASSLAPGAPANALFSVRLAQGSRGADVKRLQSLLGVESSGYFGALTRAAVEALQLKYGIANPGNEGFGTLGPKTRAKIGEVFGSGVAAPEASAQGQSSSENASLNAIVALARPLRVGASGDDVKTLQIVLNSDPDTRVATDGDGAPGSETTLFGRLTLKAIKKFQEKHGIARLGEDGYGNVGPKTRAKLNTLLAAWLKALLPTSVPAQTPAPTPAPASTSTPVASTAAAATSSVSADASASTTSAASTTIQ